MRRISLGDCCQIVSGATPKTSDPRYWDGDVEWATPADLSKLDGAYIDATPRKITGAGLASCAATVLPAGSVLLSSRAPIGHVAINTKPMATNQGFKSLIPHDGVMDSKYLYHWLRAHKAHLQSLGNGATFKELSKAAVSRIEVPAPSLAEQRRIAAILDRADALRAKRRQALVHLDDLVQSIFIDMFCVGAFPTVQAGELMPMMRNGVSPATAGEHSATVLTLSAITQGAFDPLAVKDGAFAVKPPQDKRVSSGDFLMCRGNGNLALVGAGVFSDVDRPDLVFPDTVIAGRVDSIRVELPYLNAAWKQPAVRRQIASVARTTNGTYKVNQQTLSSISVPLPSIALQRAFADRIDRVSRQRSAAVRAAADEQELLMSLQSRAFAGGL